MRRILLFVEGEGDVSAAKILTQRIVTDSGVSDKICIDGAFRVGEYAGLQKGHFEKFKRYLQAAQKQRNLHGVLVLLDSDTLSRNRTVSCVVDAARLLTDAAKEVGGGAIISVATVFASQEFESWFIGAVGGFGTLPDGRYFKRDLNRPANPEVSPRDAKAWLRENLRGYRETTDQEVLARHVCLATLRGSGMRSFRRLENAIRELADAVETDKHFVSPSNS